MSVVILPFERSPAFEIRLVEGRDGIDAFVRCRLTGGWTSRALDGAYALHDLIANATRERVTLYEDTAWQRSEH